MVEATKILLAMSGGTDSSMAAVMLLDQGYDVIGVTMRMWDDSSVQGDNTPTYIKDAQELASKYNFSHYVLDVREDFKKSVVCNFVDEYMSARTPNPCVLCNVAIKWKYLISFANEMNCSKIATGHYAKIVKKGDRFTIGMGDDIRKDQSYFLWGLSQEVLSRAIFPLAEIEKEDLRILAEEKGLSKIAKKKDSMEICFIEDDEYRDFLRQEIKDIDSNPGIGDFILKDGSKVGEHKGYPFYTIGQRKGLGIALGKPAYVTKIDSETNTITLGDREDLLTKEVYVKDSNIMLYNELKDGHEVSIKIRYRTSPSLGRLYPQENGLIKIEMYEDVSAVTPGQSAVFYEEDLLVGGGIILK